MSRKLLAFFSPLRPVRSGIADYSEKLLPGLARTFDLHLYGHETPPSSPIIRSLFQWFPRRDYELQRRKAQYAINLYQIGNSHHHQFIYPVMARYPGVVFLHDANVHHARAYAHLGHRNLVDYLDEIEWCHGSEGHRIGPAIAHGFHSPVLYDHFPMLKTVCEGAVSVLVHNSFSAMRVREQMAYDRVFQIPFPWTDVELPGYHEARQLLGIGDQEKIIASFGFITPEKGIDELLEVFKIYRRQYPQSRLVLVGGALEGDFERRLLLKVSETPGAMVTGYIDDLLFRRWLSACDICISMRYPTQGETSDALIRMMGAGKPVIIPAYRQFLDIPENACCQIPVWPNEAFAVLVALRELTDNPEMAEFMGQNAKRFIGKHHAMEPWIDSIVEAISRSIDFPPVIPLAKRCPLRHIRTAPVEESLALSVCTWGDIASSPLIVGPIAEALKELGIDD